MGGNEAVTWNQVLDVYFDQTVHTAAPNNTINVVQLLAEGTGTNIAWALTPKGTGYISAQVPDGSISGGNARGTKCVDLQLTRYNANQVADGENNWTLGTGNRTTSGTSSNFIFGNTNTVGNGYESILVGIYNNSQSPRNFMFGQSNYADAGSSCLIGIGNSNVGGYDPTLIGWNNTSGGGCSRAFVFGDSGHGYLSNSHVRSTTRFATNGDMQKQMLFGKKVTTNDTPAEVFWPVNRIVIPAGRVWRGKLDITAAKSDGSKVASYERRVVLKRVGTATTLVALDTIGTDLTEGTAISVTADDVNESPNVTVTGVAGETWRWMVVFEFSDLLCGT